MNIIMKGKINKTKQNNESNKGQVNSFALIESDCKILGHPWT